MAKKIARKSFWLRQGLEPVTAVLTVNRVKTVLTSTRERVKSIKKYIHDDVCGLTKKNRKKTTHCNSRALFTRKSPTKNNDEKP